MFRFTIRDVLWLILAVALAVQLWDSYRLRKQATELRFQLHYSRQMLESKGWQTTIDDQGIRFTDGQFDTGPFLRSAYQAGKP